MILRMTTIEWGLNLLSERRSSAERSVTGILAKKKKKKRRLIDVWKSVVEDDQIVRHVALWNVAERCSVSLAEQVRAKGDCHLCI